MQFMRQFRVLLVKLVGQSFLNHMTLNDNQDRINQKLLDIEM